MPETPSDPAEAVLRNVTLANRLPATALAAQFEHNLAVVVGINRYRHVRELKSARPDAERLAALLKDPRRESHDRYQVEEIYDEQASWETLRELLETTLPAQVQAAGQHTRVLFYFAGHGDAEDSDDGLKGFLFPQNARPDDESTLLPMGWVQEALASLPCQHVLIILDCCSAGALPRQASTRSALRPTPLYWDYLQRYVVGKARQVITSAAHNQQALDVANHRLGLRDTGEKHSPFAQALFEALDPALESGSQLRPAGRNGVVTATDLYQYVSDALYRRVGDTQTPGLWTVSTHEQGEFVFLLPGTRLELAPAPDLSKPEYNPWPGLHSYQADQAELFAGRDQEIEALAKLVETQPLVVVAGKSSAGKTSLVRAGLLPWLAGNAQGKRWHVLPPLALGHSPLAALDQFLDDHLPETAAAADAASPGQDSHAFASRTTAWVQTHPDERLLLALDAEEALFDPGAKAERNRLWSLLAEAAQQEGMHIVLTLRDDRLAALPLSMSKVRYGLGPMNRDALRLAITQPAAARLIFLAPQSLVDELVDAVEDQPAALPMLSETLHRMYLRYAADARVGLRNDRTLTQQDYNALGDVSGVAADLVDSVHDSLTDEMQRQALQKIFVRLVDLKDGKYVGRRASRREFESLDPRATVCLDDVLTRLAEQGLVVLGVEDDDKPAVELGHVAVADASAMVRTWLGDAGDYRALQRDLAAQAIRWAPPEGSGQKADLWDDKPDLPRLEAILWPSTDRRGGAGRLGWIRQVLWPDLSRPVDAGWLSSREVAFVQASVQRRATTFRRIVGITVAVIVALASLALFAGYQANQATRQRNEAATQRDNAVAASNARATEVVVRTTAQANADRSAKAEATAAADAKQRQAQAEREARRAQAGELAALAQAAASSFPQRSLLLTAEALNVSKSANEEPSTATLQSVHERLAEIGGQPLPGHEGAVGVAALSGDGRWLATGSEDETVRVWDMTSRAEVAVLSGHQGGVADVAISPDGRWLASASVDGEFRLWKVADLQADPIVMFLQGTESSGDYAPHITFTPENKWILATPAGEVWVGDTVLPGSVPPLKLSAPPDGWSSIRVFAVSPDGRWVAAVKDYREQAVLWDLASPQAPPALLEGHTTPINALAFSPDSEWLATGSGQGSPWTSGDYTVRLWNTSNPAQASHVLTGHASFVRSLAFSPDGKSLASGSSDRTVRIWDMDRPDADPIILLGFEGDVLHLVFSGDSRVLAGSAGKTIRVWQRNAYPKDKTTLFQGHEGEISALLFQTQCDSPTAAKRCTDLLISASSDDALRLWEPLNPAVDPVTRVDGTYGFYLSRISPDGQWMAGALRRDDNSQALRLWALPDGEPATLELPQEVAAMDFTADSASVVVATNATNEGIPASAQLLDVRQPLDPGRPLAGFEGPVKALALSPDGRWLAIAGGAEGGRVHLWQPQAPENMPASVPFDTGPIGDLLFSPNSRWLALIGQDSSVYLWDMQDTSAPPVRLSERSKLVKFSPDSRLLISFPDDGTAHLYTTENVPAQFTILQGPKGTGSHLAAFSPDGKWLAMTSSDLSYGDPSLVDHAVRLWDLGNLQPAPRVLMNEEAGLRDLSFSPDSRWLASLNDPIGMSLWDMNDLNARAGLFRGLEQSFRSVDFSPKGDWLLTWSDNGWPEDDQVRLWNLRNPASQPIALPSSASTDLAFSPDGRWLVGSSQLWRVHPDDMSAAACAAAGRNLTLEEWRQVMGDEPYRKSCSHFPPGDSHSLELLSGDSYAE